MVCRDIAGTPFFIPVSFYTRITSSRNARNVYTQLSAINYIEEPYTNNPRLTINTAKSISLAFMLRSWRAITP